MEENQMAKDLTDVQVKELDELFEKAEAARKIIENYDQATVDRLIQKVAWAIANKETVKYLVEKSIEESGLGDRESRNNKRFKVRGVLRDALRAKSVGVIEEIPEKGIKKYAKPVGIIASLVPTTNPVLTPAGQAIYGIKARDVLIFSPHPRAKNTTFEGVEIMRQALKELGAPEDILQCVKNPSVAMTEALMARADLVIATGGRPMKRILSDFGYSFEVVKEQIEPDGNFPTVVYANPEEVAAFKLGTALADKTGAKIVMANDPDADRIGIAVKDDNDEWYYPNGNQVGLLLLQYLLNNKKDIPANAKVITTIVSTPMIDVIAPAKNVGVMKTLTGFKYIGEKIRQFENKELDGSYLFGFEESYGYLIGTHARDKDALVTSMIIAEMAAYYNSIGSSIYKELQKLYKEFGFYLEGIKSVTLKGKDGIEKMAELMAGLRENVKDTLIGKKIKIKRDFDSHKEYNLETGEVKEIHLPKENVLQFVLEDNTYITARPSGTEPKIKFYFSVNSDSNENVKEKLAKSMEEFEKFLNL